MKKLVSFKWCCGRMGDVEGLFIAEHEELDCLVGKDVYFGEILGKHSEIYGTIELDELKVISEDQDVIDQLEEIFQDRTLCGYNPLEYIKEEEEDEDYE